MTDDTHATTSEGMPTPILLGLDYWAVISTPLKTTTAEDVASLADAHVAWLLGLERASRILASGPFLTGPGVGPGSGLTIYRVPDEQAARALAEDDPFVRAGLRIFTVHQWRLNEGSVQVRLSIGAGSFEWE